MKLKKLATAMAAGTAIACFSTANTKAPEKPPQYTNLRVLPKKISAKELQTIMTDNFQDALGVSCGFCHAAAKTGRGLDFASDAKPEKEIARSMIRMTLTLNKRYFGLKHPALESTPLVIDCVICHRGKAFPEADAIPAPPGP